MSMKRVVFVFVFPFIVAFPTALALGALSVWVSGSAHAGASVALITGVVSYCSFAWYIFRHGLKAAGRRIDT